MLDAILGAVVLFVSLIISFIFARHYSQNIEWPIIHLTNVLSNMNEHEFINCDNV
jgi:hypothetical protein